MKDLFFLAFLTMAIIPGLSFIFDPLADMVCHIDASPFNNRVFFELATFHSCVYHLGKKLNNMMALQNGSRAL